MGMVRISDDAEKHIKQMAAREGKTFTATVDSLLVSMDIAARLDKMGKWLENRFNGMEANILAESAACSYKPRSRSNSSDGAPVSWEILRDLWLDFLPDGAEEWLPGREEAFRNSDNMDMGVYYIKNGLIVSEDEWGRAEWMEVSPRVKDFLLSHGVQDV